MRRQRNIQIPPPNALDMSVADSFELGSAPFIWNDLSPSQIAPVHHVNGLVLINAAAGMGKTRTITYRIAYIQEPRDAIRILVTRLHVWSCTCRKNCGARCCSAWSSCTNGIGLCNVAPREKLLDGEVEPKRLGLAKTVDCQHAPVVLHTQV